MFILWFNKIQSQQKSIVENQFQVRISENVVLLLLVPTSSLTFLNMDETCQEF